MRRLATIVLVAAATATGVLYWLHDGDLERAVAPVLPDWNAQKLASLAGFEESADSVAPPPALRTVGPADVGGVSGPAEVDRP